MTSLIFLLTVLTLIVLFIGTVIKLIRRKPIKGALITIGLIIAGYGLAWTVFKLTQKLVPVPLGTVSEFNNKEEALQIVPPFLRQSANIIEPVKFTKTDIQMFAEMNKQAGMVE